MDNRFKCMQRRNPELKCNDGILMVSFRKNTPPYPYNYTVKKTLTSTLVPVKWVWLPFTPLAILPTSYYTPTWCWHLFTGTYSQIELLLINVQHKWGVQAKNRRWENRSHQFSPSHQIKVLKLRRNSGASTPEHVTQWPFISSATWRLHETNSRLMTKTGQCMSR